MIGVTPNSQITHTHTYTHERKGETRRGNERGRVKSTRDQNCRRK